MIEARFNPLRVAQYMIGVRRPDFPPAVRLAATTAEIKVRIPVLLAGALLFALLVLSSVPTARAGAGDATGIPTITGTGQVGDSLTVGTSGISDEDGVTNAIFSYQWIRSDGTTDTDIAGATNETYVIKPWDVGKFIKVRVSFTDDADNTETRTSAATPAVEPVPNIAPAGYLLMTGMAEVGQELWSSTDTILDGNGVRYASFSYQWVRSDGTNDVDIPGANAIHYWLKDADEGKTVKLRVSYLDDGGNSETVTSKATTTVAARPDTSELSAPTALSSTRSQDGRGIDVNWQAPEGTVTGYQIMRKEIPTGFYWAPPLPDGCNNFYVIHVEDTGSDATTYTDTDVSDGASYGYRVRAINSDGVGAISKVTHLQYRPDARWPYGPPGSPVGTAPNLASTSINGGIGLTWDSLPEELLPFQMGEVTGYQILRRRPEQCEFGYSRVHVANTGSTVTRWADRDVEAGTLYEYHIRAVNDVGAGYLDTSNSTSFRLEALAVSDEPNNVATGAPTISGAARVGETLTADGSGIDDEDGLYWAKFDYQWVANDGTTDTDIQNATASTYTLADTDEDKTIKVRVSFTDDGGYEESLTSAATNAVEALPNTPATGAPTITGTAQVDETLTADTSGIADADGIDNVSFSHQWLSGRDVEIDGATGSTYTLVAADEGKTIKVRVDFRDDQDNEESLTSAATAVVAAAPAQNNAATGTPTISGTVKVGHVLTAGTSGIADQDGLDDPQFTYQWLAGDAAITGATGSAYLLKAGDKDKTIKVTASFTDDQTNEESLTSAATAAVTTDPLTISLENEPATHDGDSDFTFDLRFSEEFELSYATLKNDAFTVTGGSVQKARRLERDSNTPNVRWQITVRPDGDGDVTITLPVTTDCAASGAICTADDRKLSTRLHFTVNGPEQANSPATGTPTISGTVKVGHVLTAGTSGIADQDGLDDPQFTYQWLAGDAAITGATGSAYLLKAGDKDKTIKVTASFTDDQTNEESLTSAATAAVTTDPLTISLENEPATHDGDSDFTFDLRFSEEFELSYATLKNDAFTVTGGSVQKARRLERDSNTPNVRWQITVRPDGDGDVTITLPVTTDCAASGAICTADDRKLSTRLHFTVNGP